jgi:predicted lipoprotein
LAHGAEAVRDQRLLPFVGPGEPNPKQALFWRSGLTAAMVRTNFEGMALLFERSGVASIGEAGAGGIDQSIAIQFDRGFAALDLVRSPVEAAVADPVQMQALNDVISVTQMLQALIGEQLATALDLSVGFSSLDGD